MYPVCARSVFFKPPPAPRSAGSSPLVNKGLLTKQHTTGVIEAAVDFQPLLSHALRMVAEPTGEQW